MNFCSRHHAAYSRCWLHRDIRARTIRRITLRSNDAASRFDARSAAKCHQGPFAIPCPKKNTRMFKSVAVAVALSASCCAYARPVPSTANHPSASGSAVTVTGVAAIEQSPDQLPEVPDYSLCSKLGTPDTLPVGDSFETRKVRPPRDTEAELTMFGRSFTR